MSIVTDALNRLKNQSSEANAVQEEPGIPRTGWYETHTAQVDRPPLTKNPARLIAGYLLFGMGCLTIATWYVAENPVSGSILQIPTKVHPPPTPSAIISPPDVPSLPEAISHRHSVDNHGLMPEIPSQSVMQTPQTPSHFEVQPQLINQSSRRALRTAPPSPVVRKHHSSILQPSNSVYKSKASQNQSMAKGKAKPSSLSSSTPTFTDRTLLREAQKFIQDGQYGDAITHLLPLFHKPPVDWEPWFWLGTAYLGNGELEQADRHFLEGLARNAKIPHLWMQRALVAQQSGDYPLAVYLLLQADSHQPDLPQIHLNLGYSFEQLGNSRLAELHYGKFLHLTDGHPAFFSIRTKLLSRSPQLRHGVSGSSTSP